MNPQAYCRKICKESGSNFVKTFYFLPKSRRLGFQAFYAFCRLVDDAVDEAPSAKVARQEIEGWSQEVDNMYNGRPTRPVTQALDPVVQRFKIPREHLDDIIAGCEMDLTQTSYETFDELKTYCYRVASCVGLVCLHMFGADLSEKTRQAAINLGMAVQITNIIRDIIPDLERNRVYLPAEDLRKYHITANDFNNPNGTQENILALLKFEIDRARSFYNKAWNDFPSDRKRNRPLLTAYMMGKIYETILNKIEKNPMRIFKEKVSLSNWRKLLISGKLAAKLYRPL